MSGECTLEVSREEWDNISHCEAVVIREYESVAGKRFARPVAYGDADEMEIAAETPGIFIVPVGFTIIGQAMVLVSDLLQEA